MSFFGSGTPSGGFSFGSSGTNGGQNQQQQQVRFGSPAPTTTTTPQSGFTFGTPTQGTGSPATSLFGATPNVQTPNTGFTFGGGGGGVGAAAPTANSGLSGGGFTFGTPNTTTTPKSTFGTGFAAPPPNVTSPMSNMFSGTAAVGGGGGGAAPPTATPNTGFTFASATAAPPAATSSPFGGTGFAAKPTSTVNFGTPGAGFNFGQQPTASSIGSSSLFGSPISAASNFGTPQTTTTTAATAATSGFGVGSGTNTGFNFGGTTTSTPNKTVTFGTTTVFTAPTTTGGLQLGSATTAAAATPLQTNLFGLSGSAGASTGVKLGGATGGGGLLSSTPTPSTTVGLNFGIGKTAAPTPTTVSTAPPTLFGLGTPPSTIVATMAPPASIATTITPGFSFGATTKPTTTTSEVTITPLTQAAVTTTTSSTLSLISSTVSATAAASTIATTAGTIGSVAVTPVTAVAATINFRKLEEDINKWTVELEEQERVFLSQATQVNAWDRILIANGEKITRLNDALESVKLDQEHLDQEIDFIHSQQNELEELLAPLEKSVETLPTLSIHQHADLEREQTFQMAENIDSQLRLMSRDLKDVIEHLNSTTAAQDTNDPIQQIGKILNSHMDSLQWIDQNTNVLRKKVDEVARVYEICRQDQEKGLQLPYM